MKGYIYILSNPAMPGLIKLGKTSGLPSERAAQLHTTGTPQPFQVEYQAIVSDMDYVEKICHKLFESFRLTDRREFFKLDTGKAIAEVQNIIKEKIIEENVFFLSNEELQRRQREVKIREEQAQEELQKELRIKSLASDAYDKALQKSKDDQLAWIDGRREIEPDLTMSWVCLVFGGIFAGDLLFYGRGGVEGFLLAAALITFGLYRRLSVLGAWRERNQELSARARREFPSPNYDEIEQNFRIFVNKKSDKKCRLSAIPDIVAPREQAEIKTSRVDSLPGINDSDRHTAPNQTVSRYNNPRIMQTVENREATGGTSQKYPQHGDQKGANKEGSEFENSSLVGLSNPNVMSVEVLATDINLLKRNGLTDASYQLCKVSVSYSSDVMQGFSYMKKGGEIQNSKKANAEMASAVGNEKLDTIQRVEAIGQDQAPRHEVNTEVRSSTAVSPSAAHDSSSSAAGKRLLISCPNCIASYEVPQAAVLGHPSVSCSACGCVWVPSILGQHSDCNGPKPSYSIIVNCGCCSQANIVFPKENSAVCSVCGSRLNQ